MVGPDEAAAARIVRAAAILALCGCGRNKQCDARLNLERPDGVAPSSHAPRADRDW